MENKKILIPIVSFFTIAVMLIFCLIVGEKIIHENKKGSVVLKLSEVHADNYPTSLADKEFARLVQKRTNGRVKIEVYTDGRLYHDEVDALDALKNGDLDFARTSCAPIGYLVPKVNLIQLPFLYKNDEHYRKVLFGSIGDFILDSIEIEDVGFIGLCFFDSGSRSFYFREDIRSVDDFAGKKIRVQTTPTMTALCEFYNATGIIGISVGEVYNKILNGIVDGAENNIPTYENMGDYLVAPYYLKTEHVRVPDILLISSDTLSKISMSDFEIVKQCAKESQNYQIQKWAEKENESLEIIKKTANIIELSEEELSHFKEKIQPIYDEYEADYGRVIKLIKDMK